jgi:membrane-associated phospholipid phosphatase
VLGILFAHQDTADRFDRAVDAPLVTVFSGHSALADLFAFPGTTIPAVALSAAMVAACLRTGRINGAVLAAVAAPAAVGLNDGLLKPWVDRSYLGQIAYPSGHTASVSALAATAILLLLGIRRTAALAADTDPGRDVPADRVRRSGRHRHALPLLHRYRGGRRRRHRDGVRAGPAA